MAIKATNSRKPVPKVKKPATRKAPARGQPPKTAADDEPVIAAMPEHDSGADAPTQLGHGEKGSPGRGLKATARTKAVMMPPAGKPTKRPAKKRTAPGKARTKKIPGKARAKKVRGEAPRAALRLERRLAGIRAAAMELGRALDEVEKARATIEDAFAKATEANTARAMGALDTLNKAASAGPLLDTRRLERELATLLETGGELSSREAKGRKRDLLAVDDFLGRAAQRLELAATGTAAESLRMLSGRLTEMQALRQKLQGAVQERFRARLEVSRAVLGSLGGAAVRLDEEALEAVSSRLEQALAVNKAFPLARLEGRPRDLYGIDNLMKQVSKRLERVKELVAVRTEDPDG